MISMMCLSKLSVQGKRISKYFMRRIRFMKNNLNMRYEQQGDYFFPCVMTNEQKNLHIGVWANRHRQYLKQFHQVRYYNLLTSEKLYEYLTDIEEQAEKMFEKLIKSLAEKENITEKLKVDNPMLWVQKMNNIRNRATEIVNSEMIYR